MGEWWMDGNYVRFGVVVMRELEARGYYPIKKRHKAKAYEAPYQFPRDLMEAIEDYAEWRSYEHSDSAMSYESDAYRTKADAIREQLIAYIETLL